jgi:hypothetical protein
MTVINGLAWIARCSFQMTFHTGFCETVLFDSWKVSSVGGLIGSMIGIFIMAALYEGLKYYRYVVSIAVVYDLITVMTTATYCTTAHNSTVTADIPLQYPANICQSAGNVHESWSPKMCKCLMQCQPTAVAQHADHCRHISHTNVTFLGSTCSGRLTTHCSTGLCPFLQTRQLAWRTDG